MPADKLVPVLSRAGEPLFEKPARIAGKVTVQRVISNDEYILAGLK